MGKAAIVQQRRRILRFSWFMGKKALAVREVNLPEETQVAKERRVWREIARE